MKPLTPADEALYALAMTAIRPGVLPGVELAPAVPEAVAVELSRRERRRGAEPAGGLFDTTQIAQIDLFDGETPCAK